MDRIDIQDFIEKVREAEEIFLRLSRDCRTLALHFLQSVVQRCSLAMCGESGKQISAVYRNNFNTDKLKESMEEEDVVDPVCVLLEELLSKVIEMSEISSQNSDISETGSQNREMLGTCSQKLGMSKTGSRSVEMSKTGSQRMEEAMAQKSKEDDQRSFQGQTSACINRNFDVSPLCPKVVSQEMHSEPEESHSKGSFCSGNPGNDTQNSVLQRKRKRTLKQIYHPSHPEKLRGPLTKDMRYATSRTRDMVKRGRIARNLSDQTEEILPIKQTMNRKQRLSTVGNIHSSQRSHCTSCDFQFSLEIRYSEHIMREHHSHPCSCKICHKLLISDDLPGHICERTCTKPKLMSISNERKDSAQNEESINSEPGLPEEILMCKYCDKWFMRMCGCPTEQEEDRFTRVNNGKILGNGPPYDEHIESPVPAAVSCGSCESESPKNCRSPEVCQIPRDCHSPKQKFYRQQDLKDNPEELSALDKYGCPDSDKEFPDINLLNVHHKIHTGKTTIQVREGGNVGERSYLCSECGKRYNRKQALQRHMKYHTKQSPYQCEFCPYSSRESNNLKRHMALHFEAKRNFMCEICGAAFHAKGTLDTHIAFKHTDSRLFQCDQCEASFKVKNALKRHLLVHSEEKSHKCWCGAGFKRLTNLRRHMIKLHGSADRLLPPVRRVKTLDLSKKAPISRTDFVDDHPSFPGNTPVDSNRVPVHQDITDNVLDTSTMTATGDSNSNQTFISGSPIHQNNSCCENGFSIVHPVLLESRKQSGGRIMSLHKESSYNPGNGTISSQTVAFANVLKQIQEVFDVDLHVQTDNN